jgi:hypothetical protein
MVAAGFCVTLLTICYSTCHHTPDDSNFITTAMTAWFHAYVQAVSNGIEHSSVCKKLLEYCVLFDTLGEEFMWKGSIWFSIKIL